MHIDRLRLIAWHCFLSVAAIKEAHGLLKPKYGLETKRVEAEQALTKDKVARQLLLKNLSWLVSGPWSLVLGLHHRLKAKELAKLNLFNAKPDSGGLQPDAGCWKRPCDCLLPWRPTPDSSVLTCVHEVQLSLGIGAGIAALHCIP